MPAAQAVYVFVSNRLFHLTNDLKDKVVPHDDNKLLVRNCLQMAIAGALAAGLGWLVKETIVLQLL
jgi:hypothetical protein